MTPFPDRDSAPETPASLRGRAETGKRSTDISRGQGSDATCGSAKTGSPSDRASHIDAGILARKHSGKSYTASVEAEELLVYNSKSLRLIPPQPGGLAIFGLK